MADIHNEDENPTPLRIIESGRASSSMAASVDPPISEGVPAADTTATQQEREQKQNDSEEEEEAGQNSGQEEESSESEEEEEEEAAKEEEAAEEKAFIFRSVNYRKYGLEVVSDTISYFPVRVTLRSSWDVSTRITRILGTMRNGEVEEKRITDSTGAKRLANKVLAGNKSIKAQELEDRLKDGLDV
ncbi:histone H3.v1-like [Pistacia vera]|uniref:histone H3.v1-like n=1 Tax=Pistacia vera TaxID=55513 RepID=UPI0012639EBB|nr:histone H3.v1-like [Pistacia vera]